MSTLMSMLQHQISSYGSRVSDSSVSDFLEVDDNVVAIRKVAWVFLAHLIHQFNYSVLKC